MTDDVWKPGGSIDRIHDAGDDNMTDEISGWSVGFDNSSQVQNNSFVDSSATAGGKLEVLALFLTNATQSDACFNIVQHAQFQHGEIHNL